MTADVGNDGLSVCNIVMDIGNSSVLVCKVLMSVRTGHTCVYPKPSLEAGS